MKTENFIDVLKTEVRKDLRRELEVEVRTELEETFSAHGGRTAWSERRSATSRHERLETWLATHLKMSQTTGQQTQASGRRGPVRSDVNAYQRAAAHVPLRRTPTTSKDEATGLDSFGDISTDASAREKTATEPRNHAPPAPIRLVQTVLETAALTFLNRCLAASAHTKSELSRTFTDAEFKHAWKKAALENHPDRFANATTSEQARLNERFTQILEAVEILSRCAFQSEATEKF